MDRPLFKLIACLTFSEEDMKKASAWAAGLDTESFDTEEEVLFAAYIAKIIIPESELVKAA